MRGRRANSRERGAKQRRGRGARPYMRSSSMVPRKLDILQAESQYHTDLQRAGRDRRCGARPSSPRRPGPGRRPRRGTCSRAAGPAGAGPRRPSGRTEAALNARRAEATLNAGTRSLTAAAEGPRGGRTNEGKVLEGRRWPGRPPRGSRGPAGGCCRSRRRWSGGSACGPPSPAHSASEREDEREVERERGSWRDGERGGGGG